MPPGLVCIGVTYADDWHMHMSALCRCAAYGYAVHILFSHFSTADPKNTSSGSAGTAPARSGPATQDVAVFPAEDDAICCVPPLPRDRPLTTGKRRFAYSLTVVHFRKVVIRKKIGSAGNGHPVI
ncbi:MULTISPECIES: hypothetical protein [Enterobacterales]|uniref:hypothetical protein n=1 Tax=Enterobacterales TaxID=91347 RepID=UPI00148F02C7|nr:MULTISPECIES: hypothetical protein [Enterobacteriaceae]EKZ6484748.1 hypothetical protein [Klebsiella pneumoniae]EKZ6490333.1 hypothetical protein [Klebsiella pneumoniae]MCF1104620.1 hypothetical protein [Klebsiella pneumoniae]MCF1144534.1 hypothetical protein [Klebsiella pneumoniae]MCG6669308.1 hypothetical protein [Klebsiella pneumoniae]